MFMYEFEAYSSEYLLTVVNNPYRSLYELGWSQKSTLAPTLIIFDAKVLVKSF
jgi:hypothetical protein